MGKSTNNLGLRKAAKNAADEFYTSLTDVEKEMKNYKGFFRDKVVFLNCDDPVESNFWKYFSLNFQHLGLKKLISTHFETDKRSYKLEIVRDVNGDGQINSSDIIKTVLEQNGDFRSPESIEILKTCDVVVTNPPFSLFREYIKLLMDHDKKFIVIGNQNAISYKEIFPYIIENKIWLGQSIHSGGREFRVPSNYVITSKSKRVDEFGNQFVEVPGVRWFTNIDYTERHEDMVLYKKYLGNESYFKTYENYDAINVDITKEIPMDWDGIMGVPITFLDKYNPDQFEIVDLNPHFFKLVEKGIEKPTQLKIKGQKDPYTRILIRNKNPKKDL